MVLGDKKYEYDSINTLCRDVNDLGNDKYFSDLNINVAILHGQTGADMQNDLVHAYHKIYGKEKPYNLQIMVVQKTAECGISSQTYTLRINIGIPYAMADLSQHL